MRESYKNGTMLTIGIPDPAPILSETEESAEGQLYVLGSPGLPGMVDDLLLSLDTDPVSYVSLVNGVERATAPQAQKLFYQSTVTLTQDTSDEILVEVRAPQRSGDYGESYLLGSFAFTGKLYRVVTPQVMASVEDVVYAVEDAVISLKLALLYPSVPSAATALPAGTIVTIRQGNVE